MPSRAKIAFSLILAAATTPCRAIAEPFASAPGTAITSWRNDNPIAVRMLTAASRPSEMIARFSIATAKQSCRAKTPPGPATIVPGPCPRMRTERAPTIRTGSATAYWPGPRQTVPPVSRTWFTASWMVNWPLACDSAVTQAVQLQSWPSVCGGGQGLRQSVTVPAATSQIPRRA